MVLILSQYNYCCYLVSYLACDVSETDFGCSKEKVILYTDLQSLCQSSVSNCDPIQLHSDCAEQSPPLPSWQKNRQSCHFPKLLPHRGAESHLHPALLLWASLPHCLGVFSMLGDSSILDVVSSVNLKNSLLLLQELKSTFPELHIFLTTSMSKSASWISSIFC